MKRLSNLTLLICLLILSGCGQTGRLYLPKKAVLMGAPKSGVVTHPPSNSNG